MPRLPASKRGSQLVADAHGGAQVYKTASGAKVILGIEDGRWHLSISHPDRDPSWEEIRSARYELVPDDAQMAMILPPKSEYVNAHPHCFHLWELKERW